MDSIIFKNYSKITKFDVSRETCNELESLISMIQKKNKEINIISRKNSDQGVIRQRHIVDSCLLYTSPSPRDMRRSRMPSSAWKKK